MIKLRGLEGSKNNSDQLVDRNLMQAICLELSGINIELLLFQKIHRRLDHFFFELGVKA